MTYVPPSDIDTMAELRVQIDLLDREILDLLALRQSHIDRAAQLKPNEGMPARIASRVEGVIDNVRAAAVASGFEADLAEKMWRMMIDAMIAREEAVIGTRDAVNV